MINVGDVIGRLTVLERGETRIYKNGAKDTEWICQCNCQNKTIVKKLYSNLVKRNRTPSCGCIGREKTSIRSKKYNRYDLSGEYGIGYASNTNNPFYFDLENYDLIKNFCWREDEKGYLRTSVITNGEEKQIIFHRLVMNLTNEPKLFVDHINHDVHDNRKQNLRIVTNTQNTQNSKPNSNNKTGIPGVDFRKNCKKWIARITVNGDRIFLGKFDTFEEAVQVRIEAENKYFGEYSYWNSIAIMKPRKEDESNG